MTDLHITNGDSAADIIKASAVAGNVLAWRDPMHHGPFPADLDLDTVSGVRARHLAGDDLPVDQVTRDFQQRNAQLRTAVDYDRVILWFEHDLLDQLQILQLLDWFGAVDLGDTSLELICIDAFEGIVPFRGLGQLDAAQMATLFDRREPVADAQYWLARAGWSAFRSADPRDLEHFLETDLTPLPFLGAALRRHLQEFPSAKTGLSRSEAQILRLVADGVSAPGRLFVDNMNLENVYFMGDWATFRHIGELCNGAQPLLHCAPDGAFWAPPQKRGSEEDFRRQRLSLTDLGKQVCAGNRDAFDLIQRDHWLGGVHLQTGQPIWTWCDDENRLLRRMN